MGLAIPDAPAAQDSNEVARRFLRSEKTTDAEEETTAEAEERVLPNTAAAKKLIPKLEKALSNNELLAPPQKESAQFALWFSKGQGPSYVARHNLKVNPLASTGKAIAVYHRYVEYFHKYVDRGIKFHFKN
jgi:hypothetical protein